MSTTRGPLGMENRGLTKIDIIGDTHLDGARIQGSNRMEKV